MNEQDIQRILLRASLGKSQKPSGTDLLRTSYLVLCANLGSMKLQLFLVFLAMFVLKLAHVVAFSWWVVTSPLTVPVALALGLPIVFAVVALVALAGLGVVYLVVKLFGFVYQSIRNIGK